MCKTTTKRANVALPPTSGTSTPGSPATAAMLNQIPPNQSPGATPKVTTMPLPANDNLPKDVRAMILPLFNSVTANPALEEVMQGPNISNCPVASILAAHAFTADGRVVIQGIVSAATFANVVTDVSALPADTLENPPAGNQISSSRFFTVTLPGGVREPSDVLYTRDAPNPDGTFTLMYMSDPSGQTVWAAVIEKALAEEIGGYENFDALPLTANQWWERITGVAPGGFAITSTTPLSQITDAALASTTAPTIGASRDDLPIGGNITPFHGFAMIGMLGSEVHLYDPAQAIRIHIPPSEFRQKFKAILFTL